ncbi:site-specific integrase [SAR92 clade bacterium H246]
MLFHDKTHPESFSKKDVERFLTHLVVERNFSQSTQSVALNALVFLYQKFLGQTPINLGGFRKASRQRKLPVILAKDEVSLFFRQLKGAHK